jgi:hypothetical protein
MNTKKPKNWRAPNSNIKLVKEGFFHRLYLWFHHWANSFEYFLLIIELDKVNINVPTF